VGGGDVHDGDDSPAMLVNAHRASICTAGRSCKFSHPNKSGIQFRSWIKCRESRQVGNNCRNFRAV